MIALLLAGWLCLPIAPLNPLEQDTLASMNLHVTAGVSSPNGVVSAGPSMTMMYEMLVVHPLVVRGGVEFNYSKTVSNLFPKGKLFATTFSADALYYRGTDHLLGYLGLGMVYALPNFTSNRSTADSLMTYESVGSVDMTRKLGYRLTFGLRYKRHYSVELSITELHPDFIKNGVYADGETSRSFEETRTGNIRLTFGYLFPLRKH